MQVATIPRTLTDEAFPTGLSYTLIVDADNLDPIEQDILAGSWSPSPAFAWLLAVIAPGDQVLDVGAHIGTFALPASAAEPTVTAVGASPWNATLLRTARDTNRFSNLTVVEKAVDRVPGPFPSWMPVR